MAEYFKIVNVAKKEYLEPFRLRCSEKFPTFMMSRDMTQALAWLTCTSNNPKWHAEIEDSILAQRYAGSWSGDKIQIIGDYGDGELWWEVRDSGTYRDISSELLAMMFQVHPGYLEDALKDLEGLRSVPRAIGSVAVLPEAPVELVEKLDAVFGADWKRSFIGP